MSGNFTYGSESIIFITEIFGYVVGIASVTCSSILIFIAVCYSPREMGSYKWYIIFNAISCAGYDIIFGLVHPEPLFPLAIFMTGGLFKHWIIPTYVFNFVFYGVVLFLGGIVYSMPLLFLYRYLQTVNSQYLKVFSRGFSSLLLCSAGYCIVIAPVCISMGSVITSQSELKELLRVNKHKIYSIAQNRNVIGIENPNNPWVYFVYCWVAVGMLIIFSTITYCVYGCYASLQRGRSAFSSRTLQLYRSLVNALMIDLGICVVMIIVPVGICGVSLYTQVEWSSTAALLGMTLASCYPPLSHMILMWFIAPYRRALIRMFKVRGRTVKDKSSKSLQLSVMSK